MSLLNVLLVLEEFAKKSAEVFDRLDAACAEADCRLGSLEGRLANAAARVEASRGSTKPLVVRSARTLGGPGAAEVRCAMRPLSEERLSSLACAAPLPEEAPPGGDFSKWLYETAAGDLSRVVKARSTATDNLSTSSSKAWPGEGTGSLPYHPQHGRITSVSELFLFNSESQPYRSRRDVDNLAEPFASWEERGAASAAAAEHLEQQRRRRRAIDGGDAAEALYLADDEPDEEEKAMFFVPKVEDHVVFDLPDILPDFGGAVADLLWSAGEQAMGETDRPIWDSLPSSLTSAGRRDRLESRAEGRRRTATTANITEGGGSGVGGVPAPRPAAPSGPSAAAGVPQPANLAKTAPAKGPPPTKGKGKGPLAPAAVPAAAASSAAAPQTVASKPAGPLAKGRGKGPPPPPKGVGKGKALAGKPPPPKKAPSKSGGPPAKAAGGGVGGGKAALFAALGNGGTGGLRQVGPPKERSGAPIGRVL